MKKYTNKKKTKVKGNPKNSLNLKAHIGLLTTVVNFLEFVFYFLSMYLHVAPSTLPGTQQVL